ncbi:MAG: HEPN domain-containing protein [Gammaproteobacteria bacterium]|nr:HEPN domain-containing protein [Gammaproteobacteria bacterium]
MHRIEKTKNELEKIFHDYGFNDKRKPHAEGLVLQYFVRSKQFLSAAAIVENESSQLYMPYLHLQGQSIELALKGYLLACKLEPKEIHDLAKLASKAEDHGLALKQIEASSIILLNHHYFQDLSTKTKFKSRYPTKTQEATGGPMPDKKVIIDLHESIVKQANKKCEFLALLTYVQST